MDMLICFIPVHMIMNEICWLSLDETKKLATKPRLTKRFTKKRMQITWFTWSSLNKLITYTATTFFTVNNVEQRSGTG